MPSLETLSLSNVQPMARVVCLCDIVRANIDFISLPAQSVLLRALPKLRRLRLVEMALPKNAYQQATVNLTALFTCLKWPHSKIEELDLCDLKLSSLEQLQALNDATSLKRLRTFHVPQAPEAIAALHCVQQGKVKYYEDDMQFFPPLVIDAGSALHL